MSNMHCGDNILSHTLAYPFRNRFPNPAPYDSLPFPLYFSTFQQPYFQQFIRCA